MNRVLTILLLLASTTLAAQSGFDQQHSTWNSLLGKHVQWTADGHASQVDYEGMRRDQAILEAYLAGLSSVPRREFEGWMKPQRRAFLLNAYNAFTVELILRAETTPESIKDLGSLFTSPWKKRFFTLFGEEQSLDGIEHGLIRGAPDYDDPRIHFAVNCASVGCPALRPEAYTPAELDAQLEDQTERFLGDRSRNYFDEMKQTLYLSKIFDWYGEDFEKPFRGTDSVASFAAHYRKELGMDDGSARKVSMGEYEIDFLDYDWNLNRSPP